jgi:hypothetical protein
VASSAFDEQPVMAAKADRRILKLVSAIDQCETYSLGRRVILEDVPGATWRPYALRCQAEDFLPKRLTRGNPAPNLEW